MVSFPLLQTETLMAAPYAAAAVPVIADRTPPQIFPAPSTAGTVPITRGATMVESWALGICNHQTNKNVIC